LRALEARYDAAVHGADRLVRTALPSSVRVVDQPDGLPSLRVTTGVATAELFFHGAHVARWTPAHAAEPVLWVSEHSCFQQDKAIRGGVPICFPWFGAAQVDPAAPAHGFVRLIDWTLDAASETSDGTVVLTFVCDIDEHASRNWPHRCHVTYTVSVGSTLAMALQVENTSGAPLTFEAALHTYCAVSDIRQVSVSGLEQTDYLDKVEGFARKRQGSEPIRFSGETDRVYLDTTATCVIADPGWSRDIQISKSGSHSTVVWNPGADRARTFYDFGAGEWPQMVCVETANVRAAAVRLEPAASHTMRAELAVR
jgi:glucose-6-phosphate 1-epimerase